MNNKGFVIFLITTLSLCSLYYLSFTWIEGRIQHQATQYAMDETGHIDFRKKQAYLDSVWKKPVFQWLGIKYTYEEVKDKALTLGLDLQGGMHVTLEVSPAELIQSLSGNNKEEAFLTALLEAQQKQQAQAAVSFTQLFYQAYKKIQPTGKLSEIFATAANRARITRETSDQNILKLLDAEINGALDRSFDIIRSRIDQFGTSQPNMQRIQGTNRIQIEFPGVHNPERVRKLLQGVAQLRFWEVYEPSELHNTLQAINDLLVSEQQAAVNTQEKPAAKPNTAMENDLAQQLQQNRENSPQSTADIAPLWGLAKPGYGLSYAIEDVPKIQHTLARPDIKALMPHDLIWLWDIKPYKIDDGTKILSLYPIKAIRGTKALLDGDVITDARQGFDEHGRPTVNMQMNSSGTRAWKKITANSIGKRIAITLDDRVYSAPTVNTEIPHGNSQITGNFSIEEAKDLANILKAGSLPAPVKIVEEAIIGPTLSQEAQTQGITSMLLGLGLVILFMILYYAQGGIIANLALLFNMLFVLGILAQLNASLTLPGIAGIVLTIGMSIDANVLIFERIREELRRGMSMHTAIQQGYQRAYSSIIDANITTFLTGAILYGLGQGAIRGFATTLMIGIGTSFFTAVFITRLIISWLTNKKSGTNLALFFAYTKDLLNNIHIDFLGKRRAFYTISSVFIGIGLLLLFQQRGLNLGVDFTGGRSYVVAFSQPINALGAKTKLADYLGDRGIEVKTYGANNVLKITTSYLIHEATPTADEQVKDALIESLSNFTQLAYSENPAPSEEQIFTIASTTKVGASIAGDIQWAAKKAIFLALIMIFVYIFIRFQRWQFSLAAVISLVHDSLAVFAACAIARFFGYTYEIDQVFIAAILTIIGYSINDTVVVFDRIRENMRTKTTSNFLDTANRAINETLSRTLITSLTTLITVLVLFIWGGEVLKGFSFALLIGIIFGTYSSICIATPLVIDLSRSPRRPRYSKS